MSEHIHDGPEPIGSIMLRYDFSDLHGNNPNRSSDLVQNPVADDEVAHLLDERDTLRGIGEATERREQLNANGDALIRAYMRRVDPTYEEK